MKITNAVAVSVASALVSAGASAGISLFQTDINTLTASSNGPFGGTTHTGVVTFAMNNATTLAAVRFDGVPQAVTPGVALAGLTGQINLVNGFVQGGSLSILVNDGSSYAATIAGGVGRVNVQAGQGFRIDGLTFSGVFTLVNNAFAGVVLPFPAGPWDGSILLSAFNPNANGVSTRSNLEVYADVPTPGGVALVGAAALVGLRRRR